MMEVTRRVNSSRPEQKEAALEKVRKIAEEIRYGSVTLVIQDGVIIQIERQEKIRLK